MIPFNPKKSTQIHVQITDDTSDSFSWYHRAACPEEREVVLLSTAYHWGAFIFYIVAKIAWKIYKQIHQTSFIGMMHLIIFTNIIIFIKFHLRNLYYLHTSFVYYFKQIKIKHL